MCPLTSFRNTNGQHVYYVGSDHAIYELYWPLQGGWNLASLLGSAQFGTGLTSFNNFNGQHVYYIGTELHIHELFWPQCCWYNNDLLASPVSTSDLSSFAIQ